VWFGPHCCDKQSVFWQQGSPAWHWPVISQNASSQTRPEQVPLQQSESWQQPLPTAQLFVAWHPDASQVPPMQLLEQQSLAVSQ
jgi:hypothetical protein